MSSKLRDVHSKALYDMHPLHINRYAYSAPQPIKMLLGQLQPNQIARKCHMLNLVVSNSFVLIVLAVRHID